MWTSAVAAAAKAGGPYASKLQSLAGFPNVPRKLRPFINFARNSLKFHDERILSELFNAISAHMPAKPAAANGSGNSGGGKGDEEKEDEKEEKEDGSSKEKLTGHKRKRSDDAPEEEEEDKSSKKAKKEKEGKKENKDAAEEDAEEGGSGSGFDFKKFILDQLKAASTAGSKMKLKRLRKAAVDAALQSGKESDEAAAEAAFEKRLAKLEKKDKIGMDSKFVVLSGASE